MLATRWHSCSTVPVVSRDSCDKSEELQDIHADNFAFDNLINPLEGLRLPRSCMTTYAHDGEMLGKNASTSRDTAKNCNNLKAAVCYIPLIKALWMTEATFNELFVLVQPHMQDYRVSHDDVRSYSERHRLLLILKTFAHVTTMRCSRRMYQQSALRQVDCCCQKNRYRSTQT